MKTVWGLADPYSDRGFPGTLYLQGMLPRPPGKVPGLRASRPLRRPATPPHNPRVPERCLHPARRKASLANPGLTGRTALDVLVRICPGRIRASAQARGAGPGPAPGPAIGWRLPAAGQGQRGGRSAGRAPRACLPGPPAQGPRLGSPPCRAGQGRGEGI